MYGELGQLNKLTQLWGGMLNLGGGCCDDGNSEMSAGPSSGGLRRDQRDALSGELMDARVERLETQTRSLMEAREESMALLRSTVGDLRDTKVRVTSMRDVCSTLAPKVCVLALCAVHLQCWLELHLTPGFVLYVLLCTDNCAAHVRLILPQTM